MHPAYKARQTGWRLGVEQRMEHDRLVPPVRLTDHALHRLAILAWEFEAHGLTRTAYARVCFMAGYEQGYRLEAHRAPTAEQSQAYA